MSEALVIAITRMGDLVQSEPFCRALKRTGVDKVTLLTEEAFVPVAEMLEGVDDVISLRFADILPQLGKSASDYPVRAVNGILELLRAREFTQVWNLTHTRPSMMLAATVGGDSVRGVTIDPRGRQVVRNEWLRYFFGTNLARPWSVYNLVDVYVNSTRAKMPFEERIPRFRHVSEVRRAIRNWRDTCVAIHPGASQRDKQWPIERFRTVARSLLDRGARVVLIGGRGDREMGNSFPAHPRLSNRIDETPIKELISLLSKTDMLISADSGPVHIAAAVGTKVIAIEGGSAHGWETAPYGTGHWILQPHLPNLLSRVPEKTIASASAAAVSVESALSVIEAAIGERQILIADPGVTIYETVGDGDNLILKTRAGFQEQLDAWYISLRNMWSSLLNSERITPNQKESHASRCAAGAREIASIEPNCQMKLDQAASRLQAEQKQLMADLLSRPPLHAVARFLEISLASVEGERLKQQALETANVFEQIARGLDWLSHVGNVKSPTSIHSNMREITCASI